MRRMARIVAATFPHPAPSPAPVPERSRVRHEGIKYGVPNGASFSWGMPTAVYGRPQVMVFVVPARPTS